MIRNNMLKGREITGLPVFAGRNHERFGTVSDLAFDQAKKEIVGLIISGGLLNKTQFLASADINHIGKDGIYTSNKKSLKRLPAELKGIKEAGWYGSRLINDNGEDKGTVADVLLNDYRLVGLEVSSGIVSDVLDGRDFLPLNNVRNANGDIITIENNSLL